MKRIIKKILYVLIGIKFTNQLKNLILQKTIPNTRLRNKVEGKLFKFLESCRQQKIPKSQSKFGY